MNPKFLFRFGFKCVVMLLPFLPALAQSQTYFISTQAGDVNVGFRKTGTFQEQYEMVVYLGNVSNFLSQAIGTTTTISNYSATQLANMCPDGFNNLQWSVFASFQAANLVNSSGTWPKSTCWYTVPRTNVNVQTTPISRIPSSSAGLLQGAIGSVSAGANTLSQQLVTSQGNTNINNNALVILEPINFNPEHDLSTLIGDKQNAAFGDFGGNVITFSVENTTPNNFNSPSVSDFYVNVPYSTSPFQTFVDPLTGATNGVADYLGYFTLNPNGSMTFTRATTNSSGGTPPVADFSGSPLVGFAPLQVSFTSAATGSITNWIWSYGDGQSVTNTTSAGVNHTYASAGNYTVSLTVNGSGGSNTKTLSGYVVVSSVPNLANLSTSGTNLVFAGANNPAGVQYRILSTTNLTLPLNQWKPVVTNTFAGDGSFHYTNAMGTNQPMYFRLVSP